MSNRVAWSESAYAGFWQRFAGRLIDWLLIGAVMTVLAMVIGFVFGVAMLAQDPTGGTVPSTDVETGLVIVLWIALVLPDFLYDTLMTSRLGWTLGKRAVGVEVRRADGELLSFGQATGRYFGRIVSAIPLYLGFFWAAWDRRKQTWHDKFVHAFVVKRDQLTLPAAAAEPAARPWGGYSGWGIPGTARPQEAAGSGGEPAQAAWSPQGEIEAPAAAPPAAPPPGATEPPFESEPPASAPPPHAAPAQETGAGATNWAHELGWDVEGTESSPALQGDSLEDARWTEVAPAGGAVAEPDGAPPAGAPDTTPPAGEERPYGTERGDGQGRADGEGRAVESEAPRSAAADSPRQPAPSTDPNVVAIGRAAIPADTAAWLQQVADQVDSRLDRVAPDWRSAPGADAARACAFGLLLGHLATIYSHMESDLDRVAEAHPSFSTLVAGSRLATLRQIAGDHGRATAWLGPLVGTDDRERIGHLLD